MSLRSRLRRWLVPGATVSSLAVPLLMGACPEDLPGGFRLKNGVPSCDECAECWDEQPPDSGVIRRDAPQPEAPVLEHQKEGFGQETPPQGGSGEGSDETADEVPDGEMDQAETGDPPLPPGRPRIPDGVLQPRPDTLLRPTIPSTPPKGGYN